MHRKFIALIIAAALAVTAAGTAPARADDDLLRALAAIAGIAIVGKVIHDRNERKQNEAASRRANTYVYTPPARYDAPPRRYEPRPLPRRASRYLLPGECLRNVAVRDDRYRFFSKRCLERNYGSVKTLPGHCRIRFEGPERKRKGYDARCLRREGYQLARR